MSESSSPPSQTSGSRLNDGHHDEGLNGDDLTADLDLGFDGSEDILRAWRRGLRPEPPILPSSQPSAHFPHRFRQDPAASSVGGFPTRVVVPPSRCVPPLPASENLHHSRLTGPLLMLRAQRAVHSRFAVGRGARSASYAADAKLRERLTQSGHSECVCEPH